MKYKLKIFLESEACPSDGSSQGPAIDIDVVYDDYGIPYIPIERIKGIIKESALELVDFEQIDEDDFVTLFEGNPEGPSLTEAAPGSMEAPQAALIFSNAYIENHDEIRKVIELIKNSIQYQELMHPLTILEQFTRIRNQNKIDENTGATLETSLRGLRVVGRGLEFHGEVEFRDESENGVQSFKDACINTRHMGMNRNRGLGEIRVSLDEVEENRSEIETLNLKSISDEEYAIDISLTTESSVIMRQENNTDKGCDHYISGGSIRGMIISRLKREGKSFDFLFEDPKMVFTNCYISENNIRYQPMMNSMVEIKDAVGEENKIYNRVKDIPDSQTSSLKGKYFTEAGKEAIKIKEVEMCGDYHHQRSEDKSFGRADGRNFFHLQAISKGQCFRGTIYGQKENLEKICKILHKRKTRLGRRRNVQYGEIEVRFDEHTPRISEGKTNRILLHALSHVILYNEYAKPSPDIGTLLQYLKDENKGLDNLKVEKSMIYIDHTSISGFNTTWGRPKPTIQVIAPGSVVVLNVDKEVDLSKLNPLFVGERIQEGFGECIVYDYETMEGVLDLKHSTRSGELQNNDEREDAVNLIESTTVFNNDFFLKILKGHVEKEIGDMASEVVIENANYSSSLLSLIGLIYHENQEYDDFITKAKGNRSLGKQKKLLKALSITSAEEKMDEICKKMGYEGNVLLSKNEIYKAYIPQLLSGLKYQKRKSGSQEVNNV